MHKHVSEIASTVQSVIHAAKPALVEVVVLIVFVRELWTIVASAVLGH